MFALVVLHYLGKLWRPDTDSIGGMFPSFVRGGIIAFWVAIVAVVVWGLAMAAASLGREILNRP